MGSVFGKSFRISSFGESHGGGVGVVVDGCPPRLPISAEDVSARAGANPTTDALERALESLIDEGVLHVEALAHLPLLDALLP